MKNLKFIFLFFSVFIISCNNQSEEEAQKENAEKSIMEKDKYLELGNKISQESLKGLSAELMKSINQDGLESAIDYCNVHAIPITSNFETTYNVKIRRVGTLIRNDKNKPDEMESEVIRMFQSNIDNKRDTNPVVMKIGENYHYFNYIRTKSMCLNCHGVKGETLQENVYNKILEKYPNDQAIGYKENDLRGIWHIIFNN